ncbi:hypothetical protein AAKU52_003555, partial [Pedobacter sp. CG_S7]
LLAIFFNWYYDLISMGKGLLGVITNSKTINNTPLN